MLAQQLVNALSLGCVYALFALGFTLIFGVLGVINLAHGAVFMVGAYAAEQAVTHFALPLWGALAFAFVVSGCLGLVIDWLVLRPLRARGAPHLIPMIATIGVGIVLTNTVQGLFGAQNLRFPAALLPERSLNVAGVDVTVLELGIIFLSFALAWAEGIEALQRGVVDGVGSTYHYIGADPKRRGDGWESIGDVGRLDEDGYLYLGDRLTDMILRGGANLYPAEIEAAVLAHPDVHSSIVVGLPDPELGNRIHAIIEINDGVDIGAVVNGMNAVLADRLSRNKHPESYEVSLATLRDDSGKARRTLLREERLAWLKEGREFRLYADRASRGVRD